MITNPRKIVKNSLALATALFGCGMTLATIVPVYALSRSSVTNTQTPSSSLISWDSKKGNPTHPTHSYLTEWGIDQLKGQYPELERYRQQILAGANSGTMYGIDLNAKRVEHKGSNWGSEDIQGWWQESKNAYQKGNKDQAYFYLGVILHMIEDMGVPAHANHVIHQGNRSEFDNFEFMALSNWKPSFSEINRTDPGLTEPWQYYAFSEDWTKNDAPNYRNRDSFSKTWTFAKKSEKKLLSNRQGRTCNVVKWALNSAMKAF
jgi:hypothetical protein